MLWESRADLGIWERCAFMRVRRCFLAAFKAWGVAIWGLSEESGVGEGGIGISGMFVRGFDVVEVWDVLLESRG